MQQPPDVLVQGNENKQQSQFESESENVLRKLTILRRTLWDIRASIDQLERLYEEIKAAKVDVGSLQEEIDSLAERFDPRVRQAKED
jgi:prefoldin subunit 5